MNTRRTVHHRPRIASCVLHARRRTHSHYWFGSYLSTLLLSSHPLSSLPSLSAPRALAMFGLFSARSHTHFAAIALSPHCASGSSRPRLVPRSHAFSYSPAPRRLRIRVYMPVRRPAGPPTHLTCIPTLTSPSAIVPLRLSLSLLLAYIMAFSLFAGTYCSAPHAPQTAFSVPLTIDSDVFLSTALVVCEKGWARSVCELHIVNRSDTTKMS